MLRAQNDCVTQAVGGDREALSLLLERHGPAVWQGLSGQIPRRWQSVLTRDDVLQQTYTDAILDIHQLMSCTEGAFAAWLHTLARRNLFDALRMLEAEKRGGQRRRLQPGSSEDSTVALLELLGGTSSTASRAAARNEATAALKTSMDALPEDYRRVVQLYDLEGRPVGEVSAALGRSEGAVFMLRARAHRRLGELMGTASKYLSDSA